ncbi:MAG: sterol desaturase family protein, partial [Sphingobacteriales bacterium]
MKILEEQWLILISTPFYFSIIVLEILLSNYRKSDTYAVKDTLRNFMFMLLNGWLGLALRATYILVLGFFFTHSVFTWHNPVLYWICLLLAEDF